MKRINKFALFILGALSFASCSDINDIESEGYRITGEQIDDATSVIPSRVEAKIAGMYSSMGTVCAAFPSDTRDDDGGYPTVCLSQDLNGPDMICANNGYNWFSVSSEYSDRYATYANPFARYAIFYNQIKAANDIILSIDPATASETEKYYLGQAKAVRAFDYLCLAPYYQFRYATSTPCKDDVLKRAFLFSILTGLRHSDIQSLKWKQIQQTNKGTWQAVVVQQKTKRPDYKPVIQQALQLCGIRPNDDEALVFEGLTDASWISRPLKVWIEASGIKKHITFHCGRHSYASLLLENGVDIYTIKSLMGHTNVKTTQIYTHLVNEQKEKAANTLYIENLDL